MPQNNNTPKDDPTCKQALGQQGRIRYQSWAGTLIVGGGITGSFGTFRNLTTGTTGSFYSIGGGGALDIGVSRSVGYSSSLALFNQGGASLNVGVGALAYSANGSLGDNRITPAGSSLGGGLGFGFSLTASGTNVYGCTVRGQ